MNDDIDRGDSGQSGRDVEHTPEEIAAFNERAEVIGGYAELAQAELEATAQEMTDEIADARARGSEVAEERAHDTHIWRIRWLRNLLISVMVALIVVVALFYVTGTDLTEILGGDGGSAPEAGTASQADGGAAADTTKSEGKLSGEWRVYIDDTESFPIFDLTFQPKGAASYATQAEGIDMSIDSWNYTENGDSVEVALVIRVIDDSVGVDYTMDAWLHLTRDGQEMRGSYEQHVIGYETEGAAAGTLHDNGTQIVSDAVYVVPKPPAK